MNRLCRGRYVSCGFPEEDFLVHPCKLFIIDFILSEIYEDGKKKGSGGIGRFFKNVGIRRSGKKYTYKKHEGKDFPVNLQKIKSSSLFVIDSTTYVEGCPCLRNIALSR